MLSRSGNSGFNPIHLPFSLYYLPRFSLFFNFSFGFGIRAGNCRAADVRHLGPGQIQETGLRPNAVKRQGENFLSALEYRGEDVIGKQAGKIL